MQLTDKTKGTALALLGTLLFGLNASTSKVILATGISAVQLVGFRSFCTALLAGLVVAFRNPAAFRLNLREVPGLLILGVIGVAVMQWAYSISLTMLPVGIALLIEYTAIVIVPLASFVLFKERFKKRLWIGVAAVLAGLAVVAEVWNLKLNPAGLLFAFLAALGTSTYFIMGEHTQKARDAYSTLFYTMLVSSGFWAIFSPFWSINWGRYSNGVNLGGSLDWLAVPGWALLLWIGIAGSFAPMIFSYSAMRLIRPTLMGIISTSEVLYAFIFGFIWLGEKLSVPQALGGALVLAGIIIAQTAKGAKWQPSN